MNDALQPEHGNPVSPPPPPLHLGVKVYYVIDNPDGINQPPGFKMVSNFYVLTLPPVSGALGPVPAIGPDGQPAVKIVSSSTNGLKNVGDPRKNPSTPPVCQFTLPSSETGYTTTPVVYVETADADWSDGYRIAFRGVQPKPQGDEPFPFLMMTQLGNPKETWEYIIRGQVYRPVVVH